MMDQAYAQEVIKSLQSGGSLPPPLQPPTPSGTLPSMDPWQQSVEKRLDSLDGRAQRLEVNVATLTENVRHLPTKPWMFATLAAMLVSLSVIVGLIVRFIPHAG